MTKLAGLLVFTMFAACILLVLLSGAQIYRTLTMRDRQTYEYRTAAQYLTTRVRQADQIHGAAVAEFDGHDALVLRQEIDGVCYETLVYCYDGWLRELFAAADSGLGPEDGETLLPAAGLELRQDGRLLSARITHGDGTVQPLLLMLRCGGEAAP